MNESRPVTCVISQFALACNLTTFYYLMTTTEALPGWFFPQSMLLYAPLNYLFNRLFLRRERTLLSLSILNGILGSAMLLGYLMLEPWRSFSHLAFAAIFLAWLTVRGCQFALNGPSLRGTLLMLDSSFVLLAAFIGYSAATGLALRWSIPALLGLSGSIIAASSSRSVQPWSPKGWLAMATAFAALFFVMWLFVGVAAAPAGHGLVALWNLFLSGVNAIKEMLLHSLLFLISLFPAVAPEEMELYQPPAIPSTDDIPSTEVSPLGEILLLILAVLMVGALLICLIRQLGQIRLLRTGKQTAPVNLRRERFSLLAGLLRLLSSWAAGIRLRLALFRGRNTAAGLYALLVHRYRRSPWHKRIGETPREFLLRLAAAAQPDEDLHSALEQLAAETDAALYSRHPARSGLEYAPLVRRRIGSAVRSHFLRSLIDRLRPISK